MIKAVGIRNLHLLWSLPRLGMSSSLKIPLSGLI